VRGEPVHLTRDGRKVEYGFYRNEYVASSSAEKAIIAAKTHTLKKLSEKSCEAIQESPVELCVEFVKEGVPLWRLLRNESFLFFPIDEPPKSE
jgi:hypothetical protein